MIVKYNDKTKKYVLWNGFAHKQIGTQEYNTLAEAERALAEYDHIGGPVICNEVWVNGKKIK